MCMSIDRGCVVEWEWTMPGTFFHLVRLSEKQTMYMFITPYHSWQ